MIEKIGKYRILEQIGRGGMGTVFKAHDPILDRLVALKVISSEGEVSEELKTRFYREAQACARLNHPNIVVVHDLGEDDGRLYIVMEFLDGEELKHLISQRRALSLEEKLAVMAQVCEGLHYAHQNGVVHRDVKPGNIFVLRNGQVKILDFGIARIAAADTALTRTGSIMGTPRYMSPEQVRGRVDQRSDQFSAGAVFYELLAHRPAFDGDDPMETLEKLRTENPPPLAQVDPSVPPDLAAAIEKALQKDPAQRFPDLGQMRIKLEQIRRRLTDDAERLQMQVRAQLDEANDLRRRLATLLGDSTDDETMPVVDGRMRPGDLRLLVRRLAEQLEQLRRSAGQAETAEPAVARALELLQAGELATAIAELEAVVREMPAHARARDALRRARNQQEAAAEAQGYERAAAAARATGEAVRAARKDAESASRDAGPLPPEVAAARPAVEAAAGAPAPRRTSWRTRVVVAAGGLLAVALVVGYAVRREPVPRPVPPPTTTESRSPERPPAPREEPTRPANVPERATAEAERQRQAEADRQMQVALLRLQADETTRARQQATAGRDQAVKAEADKLAKQLFDAARAKENDADGQASRQAYAAAIAGYRDAASRYTEAARRALIRRQERAEADQAKSRMQADKQKARPAASEFKAALAAEQQGDQTYQQLAFKEAAEHYGTAQGLFAKAAMPPAAAPPASDPRAEIRAVLDAYKKAIEGKDLALFQQVRPNLTDSELRRVRAAFEQSQRQSVELRIESIEIDGDDAQAKGRRLDVFVPKEGREVRNEAPFVFKLRRAASGWVIQAVN